MRSRRSLERGRNSHGIKFETLAEMQDSGYDSVTLPSDFFELITQQVKLNVQGRDRPLQLARVIQESICIAADSSRSGDTG